MVMSEQPGGAHEGERVSVCVGVGACARARMCVCVCYREAEPSCPLSLI
jgi:hypothetical protein